MSYKITPKSFTLANLLDVLGAALCGDGRLSSRDITTFQAVRECLPELSELGTTEMRAAVVLATAVAPRPCTTDSLSLCDGASYSLTSLQDFLALLEKDKTMKANNMESLVLSTVWRLAEAQLRRSSAGLTSFTNVARQTVALMEQWDFRHVDPNIKQTALKLVDASRQGRRRAISHAACMSPRSISIIEGSSP